MVEQRCQKLVIQATTCLVPLGRCAPHLTRGNALTTIDIGKCSAQSVRLSQRLLGKNDISVVLVASIEVAQRSQRVPGRMRESTRLLHTYSCSTYWDRLTIHVKIFSLLATSATRRLNYVTMLSVYAREACRLRLVIAVVSATDTCYFVGHLPAFPFIKVCFAYI